MATRAQVTPTRGLPSMKVPPKRKGNHGLVRLQKTLEDALNESPSEKEGKFHPLPVTRANVENPQ